MKIKIEEFEALAKENDFRSGFDLWLNLGGGDEAYPLLKNGVQVGHDIVRQIYNFFGEEATVRVVDFENETIDGLKGKFINIGSKLLGVTDVDIDFDFLQRRHDRDKELIYLFKYGKPMQSVFPEWYFTVEQFTIKSKKFTRWKHKAELSWGEIYKELGIGRGDFQSKMKHRESWTMIDLICFIELMGVREFYKVFVFPTRSLKEKVRKFILA